MLNSPTPSPKGKAPSKTKIVEFSLIKSEQDYLARAKEFAHGQKCWKTNGNWWTTVPNKTSMVQYVRLENCILYDDIVEEITYYFTKTAPGYFTKCWDEKKDQAFTKCANRRVLDVKNALVG